MPACRMFGSNKCAAHGRVTCSHAGTCFCSASCCWRAASSCCRRSLRALLACLFTSVTCTWSCIYVCTLAHLCKSLCACESGRDRSRHAKGLNGCEEIGACLCISLRLHLAQLAEAFLELSLRPLRSRCHVCPDCPQLCPQVLSIPLQHEQNHCSRLNLP